MTTQTHPLAGATAVRLPEGGRAALAFPVADGDWDKAQRRAMLGASRHNIRKHWAELPQFVRKDAGFCTLMDGYDVLDEEEYAAHRKAARAQMMEHVRTVFGTDGARKFEAHLDNPAAPISDEDVIAAIKSVPLHRAMVDYAVPFGIQGAVLATNSTIRTVVGIKCPANQANRIWGLDIGFDGTTSTNGPGIVEIDSNTWATNAPGTNSTSVTPNPIDSARPETVQSTCAKAWTTEPTVLSTTDTFFIPSYMGSGLIFAPLTKPFGAKGGNGLSVRVLQQSGVTANTTGAAKSEE